jgi:hypothetical protein
VSEQIRALDGKLAQLRLAIASDDRNTAHRIWREVCRDDREQDFVEIYRPACATLATEMGCKVMAFLDVDAAAIPTECRSIAAAQTRRSP